MTLIFNPENVGLSKVFRDWQEEAVKFIWEVGEPGAIFPFKVMEIGSPNNPQELLNSPECD